MLQKRLWAAHLLAVAILATVCLLTMATVPQPLAGAVRPLLVFVRGFAYAALVGLCLTLMLGPLARLWPRAWGRLLPARRALGIWTAVAAVLHLWYAVPYVLEISPMLRPARSFAANFHAAFFKFWGWQQWDPPPHFVYGPTGSAWFPNLSMTGIALWLGLFALIWMLVMALTSSDRAQRWLGHATWKLIHQGAYTVFFLVILHFFLVTVFPTKMAPPRLGFFWYLIAATALLQAAGFAHTVLSRHRRRSTGAGSGTATGTGG